ncbi:Girdin [Nymphon striatum]|nr:Girdin [Nymphon striatum]
MKSDHARLTDIEAENKKLMEQHQASKSELVKIQFEHQQLNKSVERLKANTNKLVDVQLQNDELNAQHLQLQQTIENLKSSCEKNEKLDTENNELRTECARIKKSLEALKIKYRKVEKSEEENSSLRVENHKLNKALETLKNSATRLLDLEQEKEELINQNKQLLKSLETTKENCLKLEQVEIDMITVTNENQRLHKSLENTNKRVEKVTRENQEFESENQKLQKTVETLKVATRRYNDLEREITDLEAVNDKLSRGNRSFEKESSRLKQAIEVKDCTIDDLTSQISSISRENKKFQKELDSNFHSAQRLKDLEKENKEMMQHSTVDKKTLVILREDLVNEKIRSQQLQNKLEKLHCELQKIGINKDKLCNAEQEADQNRYKMLENLLEDTLKNSLEIKDEKIKSLENKVKELQEKGMELKSKLTKSNCQCDNFKVKYEELVAIQQQQSHMQNDVINSSLNDQLVELKEQILDLEKTNFSLKDENKVTNQHLCSWKENTSGLQNQLISVQKHCSSIGDHNTQLQSQCAKLQVENTTLHSQNQSLNSQISTLQSQCLLVENQLQQTSSFKEELQAAHDALVSDHEALQKLHEQLTVDYESLASDFSQLKTTSKTIKFENKAIKEKIQALLVNQEEFMTMKQNLEVEKLSFKTDCKSLINLRAEHHSLKDDFVVLHGKAEKIRNEYKTLQSEYKTIKTENNSLILKNTELQGDLAEYRAQANSLDIQLIEMTKRCDILIDVNNSLKDDRKALIYDSSKLLSRYDELLVKYMSDKDTFHEGKKRWDDDVNSLHRQKEILEQKIMDMYRKMSNSPKRKGFGANLVKKVRKAGTELISRVPRGGRSQERLNQDMTSSMIVDNLENTDNSSTTTTDGSVSDPQLANNSPTDSVDLDDLSTDGNEVVEEIRKRRRNKPHLSSLYCVRNVRKSLPPNSSTFTHFEKPQSRGSYSSEDICGLMTNSEMSQPDGDGDTTVETTLLSKSNNINSIEQTPPAAIAADNLSLPGSRKAVYYTSTDGLSRHKAENKMDDDSDKIPTRDVGPGISQVPVVSSDAINNKVILNSPQHESKANAVEKNKNKDVANNKLLNNQRLSFSMPPTSPQQRYTSMINIPISAANSPNVTNPFPLPRKTSTPTVNSVQKLSNTTHPLVSSMQRKNSNSSSSSSSEVFPNVKSLNNGEIQRSKGSPVKTNESSTPSNARRNNIILTTTSSPSSSKPELPRNNSTSIQMPTTPVNNQQLQKDNCTNADNNANETVNNQDEDANKSVDNTNEGTKEKRTDNSIWYEYGCV